MASSDYNGKEKSSLNNIKELFQYLHGGGRSGSEESPWAW